MSLLVGLTRTFMFVGGMPEAVDKWVETPYGGVDKVVMVIR